MIKYSLVMRGEPRNPEKPKKAFASAQCTKVLSLEELARHICDHGCSYHVGDFLAIVSILAESAAEMLKEGYQVDLAELGRLYVTLGCKGAESMNEFNPDEHIKDVRVNWRQSDCFKGLRDGMKFKETIKRETEKKLRRAELNGEQVVNLKD